MQNAQMLGEDEGDIEKTASESSEGAIVVETLVNIRVVASLQMEKRRVKNYDEALTHKNSSSTLLKNTIKGTGQGLGSFFQMWGTFWSSECEPSRLCIFSLHSYWFCSLR